MHKCLPADVDSSKEARSSLLQAKAEQGEQLRQHVMQEAAKARATKSSKHVVSAAHAIMSAVTASNTTPQLGLEE